MNSKRIKYYGPHDWCNYWNENRLKELLNKPNKEIEINDILEVIAALDFLNKLKTKDNIDLVKSMEKQCKSFAYGNFPSLTSENFMAYFDKIDRDYIKYFWKMLNNKISVMHLDDKVFNNLTNNNKFYYTDIFSYKKLVEYWDGAIFNYLKNNPKHVEAIIGYFIFPKRTNNKWYLPPAIKNEQNLQFLINAYINCKDPNTRYLQFLYEAPKINELTLNSKTKYLAFEKKKAIDKKYWDTHEGLKRTYEINFDNKSSFTDIRKFDDSLGIKIQIVLPKKWLVNNLDYPTILNNFIFYFPYFYDHQFRNHLINLKSEDNLTSLFKSFSSTDFEHNSIFDYKLNINILVLASYSQLLVEKGIEFEQVIAWFFNEYISKEFKIDGFNFNISTSKTYLEKCNHLANEIESILKQVDLWLKKKQIDKDYLKFNSSPLSIRNIKSKISNKFIYLTSKGKEDSQILFGDQNFISFLNNVDCKSLYNYMKKYDSTNYSDFTSFEKKTIDVLVNDGVLVKQNQKIWLNDIEVIILKDIYYHGEFQPRYYPNTTNIINEMKQKNLIFGESTFLSIPEMDTFDYILNSKKFTNGLKLRNIYDHNHNGLTEEESKKNYYYFLIIFLQIIMRLDEELEFNDGSGLYKLN